MQRVIEMKINIPCEGQVHKIATQDHLLIARVAGWSDGWLHEESINGLVSLLLLCGDYDMDFMRFNKGSWDLSIRRSSVGLMDN